MEKDFECSRSEARLVGAIPSDRYLVEETVEKCSKFLRGYRDFHPGRFRVVLRELLINAIEHGNENEPKRLVTYAMAIGKPGDCVHLTIEDQGNGFDYATLNMDLGEREIPLMNRGYRLIGNLSRRLGFNAKGNRVSVCIGENDCIPASCAGVGCTDRPAGGHCSGICPIAANGEAPA